jgi:hypothetical protein
VQDRYIAGLLRAIVGQSVATRFWCQTHLPAVVQRLTRWAGSGEWAFLSLMTSSGMRFRPRQGTAGLALLFLTRRSGQWRTRSVVGTKMKKVVLVSLAISIAFNLLVVLMLW